MRSSYREKERGGGERGKCEGGEREEERRQGSVSGDVLFKEVSPCLMSLV